ncbi:S8 family peptidase [Nonomuraea typhae]|uniref:S8 family peptidase n=1 Tax=Nonomuraea typhae TaxID=2603600 RepID=UPI001C6791FD|nr:S8 family peptidase [Nonomuraea typhae]
MRWTAVPAVWLTFCLGSAIAPPPAPAAAMTNAPAATYVPAGTKVPLTTYATAATYVPAAAGVSAAASAAGTYVVALRRPPDGDVAGAEARAEAMTGRYGGRVHHVYASALRGFSVAMSADQAARLAANPRVAMVERNQVFSPQATPWGLDRVNQRNLPLDDVALRGGSASGVTAYVLDSGLRVTHSEFGGRAGHGYDALDDDLVADDCYGHGTHVAGILGGRTYGVAKDVGLVAVRVLDCAGFGTTADIVAGIDWVTRHAREPAVVNLSLQAGKSRAIDRAVRSSVATGLPYVVSAGNQGRDACDASPSGVAEAITVGASTDADERAPFSNDGRCVDLFAPGAAIPSAWITDDESSFTVSGTSMAAPHVAGAVALMLAGRPGSTPADIAARLAEESTKNVISGLRGESPNRLLFVEDRSASPV